MMHRTGTPPFKTLGTQTKMFLVVTLQLLQHISSKLDMMYVEICIYSIYDNVCSKVDHMSQLDHVCIDILKTLSVSAIKKNKKYQPTAVIVTHIIQT